MTDREPNQQPDPEEVPGAQTPGADPGEPTAEFVVAEGPDVEAPGTDADETFSEADEAFLNNVSAGAVGEPRSGTEPEHLADLRRVTAEYANYRRRVERDRDVARENAVAGVLDALLPVLDAVHLARQHGDLESGPFAAIADKLESVLARFGLSRFGEPGETFDPTVHEALMHTEAELAEGTTETTVVQVLQPGYRQSTGSGDKVLRAARVAVADPR
jgi:molecular chaperone GrpE